MNEKEFATDKMPEYLTPLLVLTPDLAKHLISSQRRKLQRQAQLNEMYKSLRVEDERPKYIFHRNLSRYDLEKMGRKTKTVFPPLGSIRTKDGILIPGLKTMYRPITGASPGTYYVATNGDDAGAGTLGDPWEHMQFGYDQLIAADLLYVRVGTYVEQILMNTNGAVGNEIVVRNYEEEIVTLDGEAGVGGINDGLPAGACGMTDPISGKCLKWEGLVTITADYNQWIGINVYRSMGRGFNVDGDNLEINAPQVSYCRAEGVLLDTATDTITLRDSEVFRNCDFATYSRSAAVLDWPAAVTLKGNNLTVQDNVIHENWGEGLLIGVGQGDNIDVYDTIVYDNFALQIYVDHGIGIELERNLVYFGGSEFYRGGNPSAGIVLANEDWLGAGHITDAVTIKNNLVFGCLHNIGIWSATWGVNDVAIINNTCVEADSEGMSYSGNNHTDVRVQNNIVYQTAGACVVGPAAGFTYDYNCWFGGGSVDADAVGANDVTTDPLLALDGDTGPGNLTGEHFRINSGSSPAINAAVNDADTPPEDYYGNPRDVTPDMGGIRFIAGQSTRVWENVTRSPVGWTAIDLSGAGVPGNATAVFIHCHGTLVKGGEGNFMAFGDGSFHNVLMREYFHPNVEVDCNGLIIPDNAIIYYMIGGDSDWKNVDLDVVHYWT